MPEPGPWEDAEQAAWYEAYCDRAPLYREAAAALLAHLAFAPDARVADLGSGTGVSARAALEALGPDGRVVGVDPAPRMVEAARRRVADSRAAFFRGTARDLPGLAPRGGFDAVLCSSALWLDADPAEALEAVRRALTSRGTLGIGLPAEYLGEVEHLSTPAAVSLAVALQEAREALGARPASPVEAPEVLGSVARLRQALAAAGFGAPRIARWCHPWSVAERLDWLGQPVVVGGLAPGLDAEGRAALLARAAAAVEPEAPLESRWILVRAEPS